MVVTGPMLSVRGDDFSGDLFVLGARRFLVSWGRGRLGSLVASLLGEPEACLHCRLALLFVEGGVRLGLGWGWGGAGLGFPSTTRGTFLPHGRRSWKRYRFMVKTSTQKKSDLEGALNISAAMGTEVWTPFGACFVFLGRRSRLFSRTLPWGMHPWLRLGANLGIGPP